MRVNLAERYPFQPAEFEDISVSRQSTGFLKPLTRIKSGRPTENQYRYFAGVYDLAGDSGYQLRFRVGGRLLTLSV